MADPGMSSPRPARGAPAQNSLTLANNLKLTIESNGRIYSGTELDREEVLTDTTAAHINDTAAGYERAAHAINNDDSRSSNWLRTKDFQRLGLRGHDWFGWFRDNDFAGVGFGCSSR
jgi:hypothetical protein